MISRSTHKCLYQYNHLVFGVSSAPAIWQRVMDQVLQVIPSTRVLSGWYHRDSSCWRRTSGEPTHCKIARVNSTPIESNKTLFWGLYCPTPILLNPLWSWCWSFFFFLTTLNGKYSTLRELFKINLNYNFTLLSIIFYQLPCHFTLDRFELTIDYSRVHFSFILLPLSYKGGKPYLIISQHVTIWWFTMWYPISVAREFTGRYPALLQHIQLWVNKKIQ